MTIDVCKVYGPDTVFLQQAAHLTNGSYIYLERRDALLQNLIVIFLCGLLCARLIRYRYCRCLSFHHHLFVKFWLYQSKTGLTSAPHVSAIRTL